MDMNLINEINNFRSSFLIRLVEQDNSLYIYICGSYAKETSFEDAKALVNYLNNETITKIISESKSIIPDSSVVYCIYFESYVGYNVTWESYTLGDDYEEFKYGKCFRIYSKSKYLDYITSNTFAEQVLGKLTHYGVYCEWQIIDIISDEEPIITKIKKR